MPKILPLLKAIVWELFFRSAFSFCKGVVNENITFTDHTSAIRLPDCSKFGHKLEKWQWRHNLSTWGHSQVFWHCHVSFVKFSYWSKFHFIIIAGSRVMTNFFYKGLTRNPEIGNNPAWVLPNIWTLAQVSDTKFATNLSNVMKCYWMLQNARFTAFIVSEL